MVEEVQHTISFDGNRWHCTGCRWSEYRQVDECTAIPRYSWYDDPTMPATLRTKTQLDKEGFHPGGPPRGYIHWRRKKETYLLFDLAEATPKRALTPAQVEGLERGKLTRRTCGICGEVGERPISKEEMINGVRACYGCRVAYYQESRRIAILGLTHWARERLAAKCVILDLETTGLGKAEIVQIGIIDTDGQVLVNSLVRPLWPSEAGAERVHKITEAMLEGAPPLEQLLPAIAEAISGREVLVYNLNFDYGVLADCLYRRGIAEGEWLNRSHWYDLMPIYAEFVGEWHERSESYRFQPLPGSKHDAAGDCRATLDLLHYIAKGDRPYGFEYWSTIND